MRVPSWVDPYIGLPYTTADCWQLIQRVYREQFGLWLPPAPGGHEARRGDALWEAQVWAWIEVPWGEETLGDVLAFAHPRLGWHAALVLGEGQMLHTEAAIDAVQESYRTPFYQRYCVGIYRHPQRAQLAVSHG